MIRKIKWPKWSVVTHLTDVLAALVAAPQGEANRQEDKHQQGSNEEDDDGPSQETRTGRG